MDKTSNTEWKLPPQFFRDNPLREKLTTGQLMWFQMKTVFDTDVSEMLTEYVLPSFDEDRKAVIQAEKAAIERLSTPEEVVRFMRKQTEIANRDFLCRKAVSMGGELSALILDKLHKNGNDSFIESAVLILSRAEDRYIDRIAAEFPQFRNAYARTEATVLLAFRNRKDALKSIYDEYTALSRANDLESYRLSQTVLYSIYMLTGEMEDIEIDTAQFRQDLGYDGAGRCQGAGGERIFRHQMPGEKLPGPGNGSRRDGGSTCRIGSHHERNLACG